MGEAKIDYRELKKSRTSALEKQLQQKLESKETGKIDSLRHTVLQFVVEGSYDTAKSELQRYVEMQKEYPLFKKRAERHIQYSLDVIQAIKTKRSFPGLHTLPMAKQQEIFEKVLDHFEELKYFLQKIEVVAKDVKLDDLRSTVWVLKSITYSIFLIVLVLFLRSAALSIFHSFDYVLDDYTNRSIDWLFSYFE